MRHRNRHILPKYIPRQRGVQSTGAVIDPRPVCAAQQIAASVAAFDGDGHRIALRSTCTSGNAKTDQSRTALSDAHVKTRVQTRDQTAATQRLTAARETRRHLPIEQIARRLSSVIRTHTGCSFGCHGARRIGNCVPQGLHRITRHR